MDQLYFFSPGETNWLIMATGVADCYYNVADLPAGGSFRFRVACVNKAGQGPYSNLSEVVRLSASGMYHPRPVRPMSLFQMSNIQIAAFNVSVFF